MQGHSQQVNTGKKVLSNCILTVLFCTYSVPSGAPQSLEAMFVESNEVFLRWRRVSCFKQNGPITGYIVRYATCGPDRGVQHNKSVVTNSTTIENLTPYIEYAFQVAAVNVNGTGPFSEPIILRGKWFHVLGYSEYNIMLFLL